MRQFGKFVIGGIQSKIFNLVVINIIIVLAVISVVLYKQTGSLKTLVEDTNAKQEESMDNILEQTMDNVVRITQSQAVAMEAYIADSLFSELKNEVQMLADYAEKLLKSPEEYSDKLVAEPVKANEGKISAQFLYAENVNIYDPLVSKKMRLLGNLADMMCSIYSNSTINSIYISTPEDFTIIADEKPASKFNEDGSSLRISALDRPWYKGAIEKGGIFFTDVEIDAFTGKKYIACSVPIYIDGKLEAVAGVDLFLDSMEAAVNGSTENGSFVFIVNDKGHIVFSPMKEGIFKADTSDTARDLRDSENKEFASFMKDALDGKSDVRLIKDGDNEYYLSNGVMNTVGWAIFTGVDKAVTRKPTESLQQSNHTIVEAAKEDYSNALSNAKKVIVILVILIFFLGITNAMILAKRIVKPLNTMAERVKEIGGENLLFEMDKVYETHDEIQVLAENFAALSKKTLDYIGEITRITAEKERISAELNVATQIQADMLPRIFPPFPDRKEFDLFASMNPAKEVGGDFYDYFLVDDDHIALIMADVSGKGVPAALFMVIAKTLLKNRAQMGGAPSEILSDVNEQLCEGNEAELFVTVWMAIIEISTGKGVAVNAGHEHPALMRKDGEYELITYKHSPALAVMEGINFRQHEFQLKPGDTLFVYTDGVAEATDKNNELLGAERMINILNRKKDAGPREVLENVMNGIEDFVEEAPQFDDITMLCFKYFGNGKASASGKDET